MHVRSVILVLVWTLATPGVAPAARSVAPRSKQVLTGDTRVTTSSDGATALVSIDLDGDGATADGIVDQAFRLQLSVPMFLAYAGPARLVYTADRLSISLKDSRRWTFHVVGSADASKVDSAEVIEVVGLARFWGSTAKGPHDAVAARLLTTACSASPALAQVSEGCSSCVDGQPGQLSCQVSCNGFAGCNASCSDPYFACCSCGDCRCCR